MIETARPQVAACAQEVASVAGVLQASSGRCSHNRPDESSVCGVCVHLCSTCTDIMYHATWWIAMQLMAGRSCEGHHASLTGFWSCCAGLPLAQSSIMHHHSSPRAAPGPLNQADGSCVRSCPVFGHNACIVCACMHASRKLDVCLRVKVSLDAAGVSAGSGDAHARACRTCRGATRSGARHRAVSPLFSHYCHTCHARHGRCLVLCVTHAACASVVCWQLCRKASYWFTHVASPLIFKCTGGLASPATGHAPLVSSRAQGCGGSAWVLCASALVQPFHWSCFRRILQDDHGMCWLVRQLAFLAVLGGKHTRVRAVLSRVLCHAALGTHGPSMALCT